MDGSLRVLLVEEDEAEAATLKKQFLRYNPQFDIVSVPSFENITEEWSHFAAVVCHAHSGQANPDEFLKHLATRQPDVPLILISSVPAQPSWEGGNGSPGACEIVLRDNGYREHLPSLVEQSIAKHRLDREKKALERAILKSKKRLQATFDGIRDAIYQVDKEFRIILANRQFADECQASPEEVIGQTCYRVYFNRTTPCDACPARAAFDASTSGMLEQPRGKRIREVWSYPVFDLDGQMEAVTLYAKDVTDKKQLEQSLIQSEKLSSIGLLASGIAHEIRNPLNIIETARYYIDEFLPEKPPDIADKLQMIQKNVQRASRIINNLLEFSRHSEFEKETIELPDIIDKTISLIGKELTAQNISYEFQGAPHCEVFFSADSLKQILLNLFINAVQAMPEGGALRVQVNADDSAWVHIRISDTGVGIPPEHLSTIFSPFFTTKDVGQGTGLGLYITHMILTREGGKIAVESEMDRGTTFTVSLPKCRAD